MLSFSQTLRFCELPIRRGPLAAYRTASYVLGVVSTHKIAGGAASGFAAYLTESESRGDYYAGAEDEELVGVWHGSDGALGRLGVDRERGASRDELVALMEGRSPADGSPIRPVGSDGSRVAGIDLTFSAPKSVSALWAVSAPYGRAQIEAAHRAAVASARERLEREELLVRRNMGGERYSETAERLVAAEYLHTASRLTARQEETGGVPDPQLHSHLVSSRRSGTTADSQPSTRGSCSGPAAARGRGTERSWRRSCSSVAWRYGARRVETAATSEVRDVPPALSERWSARSEAIAREAARFRSRYGREPRAQELRAMTVRTRGSKSVLERVGVDAAWRAVGEEYGLGRERAAALVAGRPVQSLAREVDRELLAKLGSERSIVSRRELDARAYELAAGSMTPAQAGEMVSGLVASGELVALEGEMFTTRELRNLERRALAIAAARSQERAAEVSPKSVAEARRGVVRHLGAAMTREQREALRTLTGRGGVSVLVGQAGTGKGVVLGAAAESWQREGYTVWGTAIAGATAQRLGADAKLDASLTADALLRRVESGQVSLDERSVVAMDEAGMADTRRLAGLIERTNDAGSKLMLAGDTAQLGSIGAGGLLDAIRQEVPTAELSEVHRARNDWERQAWGQVRAGSAERALAAYQKRDRLHVSDSRVEAALRMMAGWDGGRAEAGDRRRVMLTDASNREIDEINGLAQQARQARGELGRDGIDLADRGYALFEGDRVVCAAPAYQPGRVRVENGTPGVVSEVRAGEGLWVRTEEADRIQQQSLARAKAGGFSIPAPHPLLANTRYGAADRSRRSRRVTANVRRHAQRPAAPSRPVPRRRAA